jgi:hypothetical protein
MLGYQDGKQAKRARRARQAGQASPYFQPHTVRWVSPWLAPPDVAALAQTCKQFHLQLQGSKLDLFRFRQLDLAELDRMFPAPQYWKLVGLRCRWHATSEELSSVPVEIEKLCLRAAGRRDLPGRCDQLTDVSGLGGCPALHTLDLRRCWWLTDVTGLAGCRTLHTLDLSRCDQLTDVSALGGCPALHTLNLSMCDGLVDVAALGGCPALHTLNLSKCDGLDDVAGLAGCATLHTLDLSACRWLVDMTGLGG